MSHQSVKQDSEKTVGMKTYFFKPLEDHVISGILIKKTGSIILEKLIHL